MPYVTSFERIGIKKGIEKGMEKGMKKGMEKGIQQGLQQGVQQGVLEEGREMILETLDARFGEVPFLVSEAVNRIEKRDLLKSLLRCAVRCASLEKFEQALNGQR